MYPSPRIVVGRRAARLFWIAFVVRHTIGVLLFLGLTVASFVWRAPIIGWLFLVLTGIYGGYAFAQSRRLVQPAPPRRRRREQE